MAKSAKASGTKVARTRGSFTFSWHQPKGKYGDGQQFKWQKINKDGKLKDWSKVSAKSVSKGSTSKNETVSASDYYPNKGKPILSEVAFIVRGNSDKEKKDKLGWSSWSNVGSLKILPPFPPKLSSSISASMMSVFTIDLPKFVDDGKYWATHVEFQSALVIDEEYTTANDVDDKYWDMFGENNYVRLTIYDSVLRQNTTSWTPENEPRLQFNDSNRSSDITNAKLGAIRWFRARAVGPGGPGEWISEKVVYTSSMPVYFTNASVTPNNRGGCDCFVKWTCRNSISTPIDYCKIQYAFANPVGTNLEPSSPSPQDVTNIGGDGTIVPSDPDVATLSKKAKQDTTITKSGGIKNIIFGDWHYYDERNFEISFELPEPQPTDQLTYIRVNTYHNGAVRNGEWVVCNDASTGQPPSLSTLLSAPEGLSITAGQKNRISVTVSNTSSVENVQLVIRWIPEEGSENEEDIAIIDPEGTGEVTETIEIPPGYSGLYAIGVYAAVFKTEPVSRRIVKTIDGEELGYNSYIIDALLKSKMATKGGEVPVPPIVYTPSNLGNGNVRITWEWNWKEAQTAEIAWSTYEYALESTNQPSTHQITNLNSPTWIISDLTMGQTWYFWVRLIKNETASSWSDPVHINLSSAPVIPVLELSRDYITLDMQFTASWVYTSTDSSEQESAQVVCGVLEDGEFVPEGNPIGIVPDPDNPESDGKAQSIIFDPRSNVLNWEAGTDYYLAVKVKSESGLESEDWSEPKKITVVEPLECSLNREETTSLIDPDPEVAETQPYPELRTLPFVIKVDGARDTDETTVRIERESDYFLDRPDGSTEGGYAGDVVFTASHLGSDSFEITIDDLENYGNYLDDTALYRITAEVSDQYGQIQPAENPIIFCVAWDHQALEPNATIVTDTEYMVTHITIDAPTIEDPETEEVEEGDVCDIYRLSLDGVQIVYSGAEIGKTYVDPYPTLGKKGGHRIAYRTKYGDRNISDNSLAWTDYTYENGDVIDSEYHIIDFGTDRVDIMYNVDLSNGWQKDFQEKKYLGGHIQGDWNAAVSKTGSINCSFISTDPDVMESMHALAEYAGECHIRTRDGSNYVANVEVNETLPYQPYYDPYSKGYAQLGTYSMNVTRIDSNGHGDGMTENEWRDMIGLPPIEENVENEG